jgi:GAF domain-containing protein
METGITVLCVDGGPTAEATGLALEMRADGVDVLDASNPRVATATLEREGIDVLVFEPGVGQDDEWDETLRTAAERDVTVIAFSAGRPALADRPEVAGHVDKSQPDQFERLADRVLEAIRPDEADYPLSEAEEERSVTADRYGMAPLLARPSLERLCRLTAETLGVSAALLGLVDRTRYQALAAYGTPDVTQPRRESLCARTFLEPGVACIPDLKNHEWGGFAPSDDFRWYASARLVAPDGHPVGTLAVYDESRSAPLSDGEQWRLSALADEAMEQLELRRLIARPQDPDTYISTENELTLDE